MLSPEDASDLHAMCANLSSASPSAEGAPFIEVGVRPGETVVLTGEALRRMDLLVARLTSSALSSGGLSSSSARNAVLGACVVFWKSGEEAAASALAEQLEHASHTWLVVRPVRASQLAEVVLVGRCQLRRGLPQALSGTWPDLVEKDFSHYSIATSVSARDLDSARLIAEQNFAESIAILRLTSYSWLGRPHLGDLVVLQGEDGVVHRSSVTTEVRAISMVDSAGNLWPHLDRLSRSTSSANEQTDWERRCIAAARWLDVAASASWPSEALVALMVALETLFVPPYGNKGATIAREVSQRWVLVGFSQEEEREWLLRLYRSRSDTVHEGQLFERDSDVFRLYELAWQAVSWAAVHLNPQHWFKTAPCLTQAEALSEHSSS